MLRNINSAKADFKSSLINNTRNKYFENKYNYNIVVWFVEKC